MKNRFIGSTFSVVAVLAFSTGVLAQTAKQPGSGRDLSGVWGRTPDPEQASKLPPLPAPESPVLTKWGQDQYDYNHDTRYTTGGNRVRAELDPSAHCFPPGVARLVDRGAPFQIFQTPKEVVIIYENNHEVRYIYTDGRQHPNLEDYDPTWNGHSIGKWDGDTLVVDTVGIREETLLDNGGRAHSDQLHIVERFQRLNHDTLQIDRTFEDPIALAKPWVQHIRLALQPSDFDILPHVICGERYRKALFGGESPSGL